MFEAYTPSEVALRLPVEVTCLSYQDATHSVLAGGKVGHLYVYSASQHRRGFELHNICKKFERKAVLELCVCEREDILLCVSDGQLVAHRLSDAQYTVETLLHKLKPVVTFAKFTPKGSGTLYVLVSSKKRLHLFKWGDKDGNKEFLEVSFDYNPVFVDNPTQIKCVDESVFFSVRDEYFVMTMQKDKTEKGPDDQETESWTGFIRRLLNFQSSPNIVPMRDRNRVAFVRNEMVVTTNLLGDKAPEDYKFSETPLQLVYDAPYLVALLSKGRVEVRSSYDGKVVQTMSLNKAVALCNGHRGHVFAAATSDIWMLDTSVNLRKNVSLLIQERQFELAIQLADNSSVFSDENKAEIKRQAALNLFHQKKFEESFALYSEIKTDVVTIIQMFPELLPEGMQRSSHAPDLAANDKIRALLALGNFLSATRTEFAQRIEQIHREKAAGGRRVEQEEMNKMMLTLRVVDTTLLKCFIKTKPTLVDSLIRLKDNACSFDDAEAILKKENRMTSLFILYESKRRHDMALDLLIEQSTRDDADVFFSDAIEKIVEYLQSMGNIHLPLIFRYAKWVLSKDLEAGVQVFTSDETDMARNLDRRAVVEFLRTECVAALIPYLEHVIYKWEEPEASFHETLLERYVAKVNTLFKDYVHAFPDDENMTRAGDEEGDLGKYRQKLLKFLQFSSAYSPQTILLQLAPHAFYEERALILGRLKQHEHALRIYICVLKNIAAAEAYCDLYYNAHDESNSQVYLQLFRALVAPPSPPADVIISPFGSFRDDVTVTSDDVASETSTIKEKTSDVHAAIKILSKHADKIDTVSALSMIPPETPLRVVSNALNAVLQTTHDNVTTCSLQKCVSNCALEKKETKRRDAESVKIVVNMSSDCVVCKKKIGVSAFVRYQDSTLAHFYCFNDQNQNMGSHHRIRTISTNKN